MRFCPACNGFQKVKVQCAKCSNRMKDLGRKQDYDDKYSAYEEYGYNYAIDTSYISNVVVQCEHIMFCEHCNTDTIISVDF